MNDREKHIAENLELAEAIARSFRTRLLEYEDRVQEASLALVRAADHFDESYGVPFSKFARVWIKRCLLQAIAAAYHRRDRGDGINLDAITEEIDGAEFDEVWDALELLPERDQSVMVRLFDLDRAGRGGREAASRSSGLSVHEVRQIKRRSLKTMRRNLSA